MPREEAEDRTAGTELQYDRSTIEVMDSLHPGRAYRFRHHIYHHDEGGASIQRTDDSGRTWRTEWRLPEGRREYVEKLAGRDGGAGPFEVLDLVILPHDGTVVAALDIYGVLVRDESGRWSEHGYENGRPFSAEASSIGQALGAVGYEYWILVTAMVAAAAIIGIAASFTLLDGDSRREADFGRRARILVISLLGTGAGLFIIFNPEIVADRGVIVAMVLYLVGGITMLAKVIGLLLRMRGLETTNGRRVIVITLSAAAMTFVLSLSIFALWAFGTIHSYSTAIHWSIAAGCAALIAHLAALVPMRRR